MCGGHSAQVTLWRMIPGVREGDATDGEGGLDPLDGATKCIVFPMRASTEEGQAFGLITYDKPQL